MPDYSKGKVYELVCRITNKKYIGSTTQPLAKRKAEHYKNKKGCSSKEIIVGGDYYINLLEECPCENKEQLLRKEREWYDKVECVNKHCPIVSPEEEKERQKIYNQNNKEHHAEWKRNWRLKQKEE